MCHHSAMLNSTDWSCPLITKSSPMAFLVSGSSSDCQSFCWSCCVIFIFCWHVCCTWFHCFSAPMTMQSSNPLISCQWNSDYKIGWMLISFSKQQRIQTLVSAKSFAAAPLKSLVLALEVSNPCVIKWLIDASLAFATHRQASAFGEEKCLSNLQRVQFLNPDRPRGTFACSLETLLPIQTVQVSIGGPKLHPHLDEDSGPTGCQHCFPNEIEDTGSSLMKQLLTKCLTHWTDGQQRRMHTITPRCPRSGHHSCAPSCMNVCVCDKKWQWQALASIVNHDAITLDATKDISTLGMNNQCLVSSFLLVFSPELWCRKHLICNGQFFCFFQLTFVWTLPSCDKQKFRLLCAPHSSCNVLHEAVGAWKHVWFCSVLWNKTVVLHL